MDCSLNIIDELPVGISKDLLNRALELAISHSQIEISGQINLIFVSKPKSRALNHQYAGNDYPTDVLSFNYFEGRSLKQEKSCELAEIVICSQIAKEQARRFEVSLESEICLLLVHGVLHILGLDHQDQSGIAGFLRLQSAIMNELGLKTRQMYGNN